MFCFSYNLFLKNKTLSKKFGIPLPPKILNGTTPLHKVHKVKKKLLINAYTNTETLKEKNKKITAMQAGVEVTKPEAKFLKYHCQS